MSTHTPTRAHRRTPAARRTVGALFPLMAILSSAAAVAALFLLIDGMPQFAAAAAILLVLTLAFGAADTLLARGQIDRHGGDVRAALEDSTSPEPVIPVNRESPFGGTSDSHDDGDLSPHDLLPGEPMRTSLERRQSE